MKLMPWKARPDETRKEHWMVTTSAGLDIADVLPWMPGPEVAERARLMAAAPEMAMRLRAFVDGLRRDEDGAHLGPDDTCDWCKQGGCSPTCGVTQAENLLRLLGVALETDRG